MAIPRIYLEKDSWPHGFTKATPEYPGWNGKMWQGMICKHCGLRYIHGKDPKPVGKCPARYDKTELKRILS